MKKFSKIAIVAALLLIGIVAWLSRSKPTTPPEATPKPSIPKKFQGSYKIELDLDKKDFKFPSEAPGLTLTTSQISDEKAKEIAKKLNFTQEPEILQDYFDGTVYFWRSDDATLLISIDIGKIKYSLHTISTTFNKQLTDDAIKSLAYDFLTTKFLIGSNEIKFSSLIFFKQQENIEGGLTETTKENASVYRVVFTPQAAEFELLTINPQNPPYSVDILTDGEIFQAEAVTLTNVSETTTKYKLLNFEEFQNSLNNAVLIGVTGAYVSLADIPSTAIKLIKVNDVKLAYLLDTPDTRIYSPVFLLRGSIEIKDYQKNLKAELYLPAIKAP